VRVHRERSRETRGDESQLARCANRRPRTPARVARPPGLTKTPPASARPEVPPRRFRSPPRSVSTPTTNRPQQGDRLGHAPNCPVAPLGAHDFEPARPPAGAHTTPNGTFPTIDSEQTGNRPCRLEGGSLANRAAPSGESGRI